MIKFLNHIGFQTRMIQLIPTTLAEELEEVRHFPASCHLDRNEANRNILEDWRKKNILVEYSIQGKANVKEEFKYLCDKYMGSHRLLPQTIDEVDKQRIDNLDQIVGYVGLYQPVPLVGNPVGLALIGAAIVMVPSALIETAKLASTRKPYTWETRREFLKFTGLAAIIGLGTGTAMHYTGDLEIEWRARKNAAYVQEAIETVYCTK